MPLYDVKKRVRIGAAVYEPGSVVELDEYQANRAEGDEPGTLTRHVAPPATRTPEAPPADRMIRTSRKRGKA